MPIHRKRVRQLLVGRHLPPQRPGIRDCAKLAPRGDPHGSDFLGREMLRLEQPVGCTLGAVDLCNGFGVARSASSTI